MNQTQLPKHTKTQVPYEMGNRLARFELSLGAMSKKWTGCRYVTKRPWWYPRSIWGASLDGASYVLSIPLHCCMNMCNQPCPVLEGCTHTHTLSQSILFTGQRLHTEAFTQRGLHAEQLLHTETFTRIHTEPFTRRSFFTRRSGFHKGSCFAHKCFCTEKTLHREAFTHRSFYTQEPLHMVAFTQKPLHRAAFAHKRCYTQRPFHRGTLTGRSVCTEKLWHR